MDAKEFLINQLNRLIELRPELHIRYKKDDKYNTHIIEVNPSCYYYQDENYREYESNLEELFEDHFPKENILFITQDSLNKIDTADHEFKSKKFNWIIDWEEDVNFPNIIISENYEENYALAA